MCTDGETLSGNGWSVHSIAKLLMHSKRNFLVTIRGVTHTQFDEIPSLMNK